MKCHICGKECRTPLALANHILSHEPKARAKRPPKPDSLEARNEWLERRAKREEQ